MPRPAREPIPPRIAPPEPADTAIAEFRKAARLAGLTLRPWQLRVARAMQALAPGRARRWLYPEVAVVIARQNGKSTLLVPLIVARLLRGERIMHTAQNRELPREVYRIVAAVMIEHCRPLLDGMPRRANGQEAIRLLNGGVYRIVAPNTAGARGYPNDLLLIDEARELEDFTFMAAAQPTLTASANPQAVYLSNAGDDGSVVLNALRKRAADDTRLAYLEWSAAPERAVDDRQGWREANPSLGYNIALRTLEDAYRTLPASEFETEHLCRWVTTMLPRLINDVAWHRAQVANLEPRRPVSLGLSFSPTAQRASAVYAWREPDGTIGLQLAADVEGSPVDLAAMGRQLAAAATNLGIVAVGFDSATDRELARYFANARAITGQEFAGASERLVALLEGGQLRHAGAAQVGADLAFTARRYAGAAWYAIPAHEERPVTAALAAIRAAWLATDPNTAAPVIY